MSGERRERWAEQIRLLRLSARTLAGRRFWIWPLAAVAWPALQIQ